MRKIIHKLLLPAVACLASLSHSYGTTLKVVVEQIEASSGKLDVTLYTSEDNWLKNGLQKTCEVTDAGSKVLVFEDVEPGVYAVSAVHDVDGNGRMNTGAFGKPTEPYGFSNNARKMFGPAEWNAACFKVEGEMMLIHLSVR